MEGRPLATAKSAAQKAERPRLPPGKSKELVGLVFGLLAVLLLVALVSFHPADPSFLHQTTVEGSVRNLIGPAGSQIAAAGFGSLGLGVLLVPVLLGIAAGFVNLFRITAAAGRSEEDRYRPDPGYKVYPPDDEAEDDGEPYAEGAAGVREGVRLIHSSLLEMLARYEVQPMECLGEAFDPHLHEAVMHEPSDEIESDHVTRVLQKGYFIGERVLRPARVAVSP